MWGIAAGRHVTGSKVFLRYSREERKEKKYQYSQTVNIVQIDTL